MRQLSLHRRVRRGSKSQRQVSFLDLVVSCGPSHKSLYDELCRRGYDYVSCIGWLSSELDREARARLALESPGDLEGGRSALYICPECADLGCGAISVLVSPDGADIVWSGFGLQNNYEEGFIAEERLGPFRFDAEQYLDALQTVV